MNKRHKSLTIDKWSRFVKREQLLMIANELNRAKNQLVKGDEKSAKLAWERAFELIDLTISDKKWQGGRKAILELRESLGRLYQAPKQSLNQILLNCFVELAESYK